MINSDYHIHATYSLNSSKGAISLINSDYHIHTNHSLDSTAEMEKMILSSIEKGLTEIALTDHVDYIFGQNNPSKYAEINYDNYILEFNALKSKYENKINILFGVEMGLDINVNHEIEKLVAKYPFEFIIGSSHTTHSLDLYTGEFFLNKNKETAFNQYFEEILENVKNIKSFDVYGHFDYITRYSHYKDNSLKYLDFKESIDEVLKALIEHGKGLEINTSGYRYGLNQVHPQLDILKAYKQLGGEIITIGSDAHKAANIAENFDKAENILLEAGFKAYSIFRNRKPVFVDIRA